MMQDELDLRPYLLAIARQWRWIVLLAVVYAGIAAWWTARRPTTYTASASVLVRSSQSRLTLDERYQTTDLVDAATYRRTLLELIRSHAIEARILAEVRERLAGGHYSPGVLAARIGATAQADLLVLTAEAPTANEAQELADVWTTYSVQYVNELFASSGPDVQAGVEGRLTSTQEHYQLAQLALEEFLSTSQIDALENRIVATEGVISETQGLDQERYRAYLLSAQQLDLVRRDAEALRTEVAAGQADESNTRLASLLLRVRASAGTEAPIDLELSLNAGTEQGEGVATTELDSLISALDQHISETQAAAAEIAAAVATNQLAPGSRIAPEQWSAYFRELADLRRQLEAEVGKLRALELERDVALEALQAVQRKAMEQDVNADNPDPVVRVASEAALPGGPAPRPVAFNTLAAGLGGLVCGSMIALLLHLLRLFGMHTRQQANIDQRANSASSS